MTAKKIHPTMERLYRAAKERQLISGECVQTEFSKLINASPQKINNWEKRGISKEGRLLVQQAHGINASWVETGLGSMFLEGVTEYVTVTTSPVSIFVKTAPPPTAVDELVRITGRVSEEGLKMILSYAYHVETTHPAQVKQTPESTG